MPVACGREARTRSVSRSHTRIRTRRPRSTATRLSTIQTLTPKAMCAWTFSELTGSPYSASTLSFSGLFSSSSSPIPPIRSTRRLRPSSGTSQPASNRKCSARSGAAQSTESGTHKWSGEGSETESSLPGEGSSQAHEYLLKVYYE